jgi:hypothetical protein
MDAVHDNAVKVGADCPMNPPDDARAAAGRRNSADDQELINDIHDRSVAAGANCDALDDDGDEGDDDGADLKDSAAFAGPDPYAAGIAALRAANNRERVPVTLSASERQMFGGMSADIERMRNRAN